jgi:hypothetical protein
MPDTRSEFMMFLFILPLRLLTNHYTVSPFIMDIVVIWFAIKSSQKIVPRVGPAFQKLVTIPGPRFVRAMERVAKISRKPHLSL